MSRLVIVLIALMMAFTASASHAKVAAMVSGTGHAAQAIEHALVEDGDHTSRFLTIRCVPPTGTPTGSPTNVRAACPFEAGTRAEAQSMSGRGGRQEFPAHRLLVHSGPTDDPDHGPPKSLS